MARPGGIDEVEGIDEEFLYHLGRGSDLLARGDAEEARISLERALDLRPKDTKVLGLLGQVYYRLGQFERAAVAYGRLVDENPVEAAARVNLGLANLKSKRLPEAVRQLNIALDLNPDHRRAMNYLGLALLESGRIAEARDWFARARSDHMVARCDELLASGGPPPASGAPSSGVSSPEPPRTTLPGAVAAAGSGAEGYPALLAYAASRVVAIPSAGPFSFDGRTVVISVRGEMLARNDGLFAVRGALKLVSEMKRFRGRETDQPFGEGAERMRRISGDGALFCASGGRRFTPLHLAGDAGYFREDAVFALEEGIGFDNGRVASRSSGDLNLVHLRGHGCILLVTRGEPLAVEVEHEAPLRVPFAALVGWIGALTPRVVGLGDAFGRGSGQGEPAGPAALELTGEGRALVDPDRAGGPDGD